VPDVRPGDVTGRAARAAGASVLLLALLPSASARADVYVLLTGDRITGKPVGKAKRAITVETPFGRLVIPRSRIQRIIKDDGSEEVVNPPLMVAVETPEPAPPRPVTRPWLIFVIQGQTFFYAWAGKDAAKTDPSLRLEVRLDEEPIASWVDAKTDPDIKGAVLNMFSFAPEDVSAFAGPGVELAPPEVQPGRAVLKIGLAPETAHRRLRFAYQINDGNAEHPAWHDQAEGSTDVELHADAPTIVQVRQSRGKMDFSGFLGLDLLGRRMKNVGTFRIDVRAE
jgi:hypothetical protein